MENIDIIVIIVYFFGITGYGIWISRNMKTSDNYFRGGRKFKWWTMVGQAFGTGTHAEMPVAQAGAAFQGGFATIWYQWKNLLITPLYWLIAPWYRRSERTTTAELVRDRYGEKLGVFYTIFAIVFFVFIMGAMLQGAAKVISVASGGQISSNWVVVGMTLAFMVYSFFGGLVAAAHTEFIQGLFIIVLSFLLIPSGLREIGGFSEMRQVLPADFFLLFSKETGLGAFTIAMLAVNGLVGITAQPHMMSMFATGESELVGRIGQTYGNFVKRLVTIGWTLTGLIVAAVVIKKGIELDDPEHAFGFATALLLGPGLIGLMMASILAANMSSCSNFMVNLGALFTKDIYQPYIKPSASDQELLRVGRIAGLLLTLLGVVFALSIKNVLSAFLFTETIAAFMGIMIFGGIMWKGANRYGALSGVVIAFVLYYLLNYMETGELILVYKWTPAPFGWAMLAGFILLVLVSKLTRREPTEAVQRFFQKMYTHSDQKENEPTIVDKELLLLDVNTWFTKDRWKNFTTRYKTDFFGFLLGWLFVAALILLAWLILQIK
ncbi:MAG: sodium:solute symporter family protein [Saprospiraceae bacterium]|nr:sodium:solute symporter family protein [Saprospiraceae bacterium]